MIIIYISPMIRSHSMSFPRSIPFPTAVVVLRRDLAVLVGVGQFKDLPKLFAWNETRVLDGGL